jgi:enoyl-CoA hydratase/carnithine racemase
MFETLEVEAGNPDADSLEAGGSVGRLWLNRPDKLNPLSTQTLEELVAAAAWFDGRPEIKAVIVGGRGRTFCAGADLEAFVGLAPSEARRAADAGRLMAEALEGMRAITIARLQGWCVGGGLVLAAACDLRVAAASCRFSIPEVELGIPLAWGGIPRLVREIGPVKTRELVITCRPFSAEEALSAGLLNRVVGDDELDPAVEELASRVARMPTFPVWATKRHVDAVTRQAVGTDRAWGDADSLVSAMLDAECAAARDNYLRGRR